MKKININKNLIYKINSYFLIGSIFLSLTYILFVYRTVNLASGVEQNNKKIFIINQSINDKEFKYIEKVSSIDFENVLSMGYKKNSENVISYFNIKNNSEFARR